jgi:hypothetical protein
MATARDRAVQSLGGNGMTTEYGVAERAGPRRAVELLLDRSSSRAARHVLDYELIPRTLLRLLGR